MSDITEYSKDIEDLFIQFMVSDPELFVRCKGILSSKYFDNVVNSKTITFLEEHSNNYATLPTLSQIKAVTGKTIEVIEGMDSKHKDWFLHEFEIFARHKALEIEILKAPDLLEKGKYGEVEANIKAAVQIGLVKDLGTDYFHDPVARLEAVKNNSGMVSTGWKTVDYRLYGGFNRGEITVFCGQCVTDNTIVEVIMVPALD